MASVFPMLAMPTTRDIPFQTVLSLLDTQQMMFARGVKMLTCVVYGCSTGAFDGRNRCAHKFLESDCTHLFWIDSDTSWDAEDFWRLLSLGTQYPFVAGVAPRRSDPPKFPLRILDPKVIIDKYGCAAVKGVGLAFACVQRKVMEQLAEKAPLLKLPDSDERQRFIFRCEPLGDELWGEDSLFCNDIAALGYEIKIEPKIVLGHIGNKEFRSGCLADTWKRIEA